MKNCHVCNFACEDNAEVCVVCGAYLDKECEQAEEKEQENKKIEPVLLATISDVVSAEIFKDILTDNKIPYSDNPDDSMRVVFGGVFAAEEIYVDKVDFDKAQELYREFLASEGEFSDGFEDFEEEL